jgi:hypothetical protein
MGKISKILVKTRVYGFLIFARTAKNINDFSSQVLDGQECGTPNGHKINKIRRSGFKSALSPTAASMFSPPAIQGHSEALSRFWNL